MADIALTSTKTVRQRIVEAFQAVLAAMVAEDSSKMWQKNYLGDITDLSNAVMPCTGLDEGTEIQDPTYGPCSEYLLPMFFYFRWAKNEVDNHDKYRYYLGMLKAAIFADLQLGGLLMGIHEESNAPSIFGQNFANPGGVLSVTVRYRTAKNNPYKLVGEL